MLARGAEGLNAECSEASIESGDLGAEISGEQFSRKTSQEVNVRMSGVGDAHEMFEVEAVCTPALGVRLFTVNHGTGGGVQFAIHVK